ncbi:signal recognition particle-docking protein FtsY [Candidatus Pantoea edessiphila]|uniref:Signal recognition particle receptor FtsY n=1 Tax=Candidatus Pantoea edessiphila TaxID=2044610 RepID=A0A2P5T1Q8_9GAMM|nr:signal recognition particle-docking protein FtsY [Candidatus Pantoea edessiphila]PPI88525.1 signal recognition particle-docking protein FtsY [Candidatus Pantoea edessiphila]
MTKKKNNSFFSWLKLKKEKKDEAEKISLIEQEKNNSNTNQNDFLFNNNIKTDKKIINDQIQKKSSLITEGTENKKIKTNQEIDNNLNFKKELSEDIFNASSTNKFNKSISNNSIDTLNNKFRNVNIQNNLKKQHEGLFTRLKNSLTKTRQNLTLNLINLFKKKSVDKELFDKIEEQLLIADVGIETTKMIINNISHQAKFKSICDTKDIYILLKNELANILTGIDIPLEIKNKKPFVILMVGVNGVGKTTTIGKLSYQYNKLGKSVILAAGDTFRAAAIEQLQFWGETNKVPVIAQHKRADSASVIFDAIKAAKSRETDIVIADSSGRLHNKLHLMEELKKTIRVIKKIDGSAPHEIMLIIDANTGQNAVIQAKSFYEFIKPTGITITKLDGTAKGGVIFSIANQLSIPIRYICIGESREDIRTFKSIDFIEALFS